MKRMVLLIVAGLLGPGVGSQGAEPAKVKDVPAVGSIERFDPLLDAPIAPDAKIYKLAEGFGCAEGPVWLPTEKALLFSDIPGNTIHRWSETGGLSEFLRPSGSTGLPDTRGKWTTMKVPRTKWARQSNRTPRSM
jgi:gluconolactonase